MRFLLLFLLIPSIARSQPVEAPHIEVELVSASTAVVPGEPFMLALRMTMEEGWHTYWRNPGDAGLPTEIEWLLPRGFSAGEIQWPAPTVFGEPPGVSYGYANTVLLPVRITPPEAIADTAVTIRAEASWLVCREECISGVAELGIRLPVKADSEPSDWAADFERAYWSLPTVVKDLNRPKFTFALAADSTTYTILIGRISDASPALPGAVWFFPYEEGVVDHSAEQMLSSNAGSLELRVPISPFAEGVPERIIGVLLAEDGWSPDGSIRSLEVELPVPAQ